MSGLQSFLKHRAPGEYQPLDILSLRQDCGRLQIKIICLFSMMLLCKNDDLHNFFLVSIEFLKVFSSKLPHVSSVHHLSHLFFSLFLKYYNYLVTGAVKSLFPKDSFL